MGNTIKAYLSLGDFLPKAKDRVERKTVLIHSVSTQELAEHVAGLHTFIYPGFNHPVRIKGFREVVNVQEGDATSLLRVVSLGAGGASAVAIATHAAAALHTGVDVATSASDYALAAGYAILCTATIAGGTFQNYTLVMEYVDDLTDLINI